MLKTQVILENRKDIRQVTKEILSEVKQEENTAVLALCGNLGSGKTTFTQELAKELGIAERVVSPTFVLEKIYKIRNDNRFSHLVHIDAYRISDEKELYTLGWSELLKYSSNLIVIEWAQRIKTALPKNTFYIYFKFIDENKREIQW